VQPYCEERQSARHIDQSGRNPNDEPTHLLVFKRRQAPGGRRGNARRIPDSRSKGQQGAENAPVEGSGKQVKHAAP
jgi:hypothetical protein